MTHEKGLFYIFNVATLLFTVMLFFPANAFAQYVPVKDHELIQEFNNYQSEFGDYRTDFTDFARNMDEILSTDPDSIRNIITGANLQLTGPGGVGACSIGDNLADKNLPQPSVSSQFPGPKKAYAYTQGPWASTSAVTSIPLKIPDPAYNLTSEYVQVNNSHSLRCLLEQLVDQQDLGLSLQIHLLLKEYIADAQTAQLQNQLTNKITGANLEWAKNGNIVDNNGVISSTGIYNTNAQQNILNTQERQLDHALVQAAADPSAPGPLGSWGVFSDWRLDTTANMANNAYTSGKVVDPFDFTQSMTQSDLQTHLSPGDSQLFFEGFNDPASLIDPMLTWDSMLSKPANSPLGAATLADQVMFSRLQRQEQAKRDEYANSGVANQKVCSGRIDDPYCLDTLSTSVSPAGVNSDRITQFARSGDEQVATGKDLDTGAGTAAMVQSTQISSTGLAGYDTTDLSTSKTAVMQLVKEFYDTLDVAYFGVTQDRREWAKGTMLMIYDEMKFDPESTRVIVTEVQDPVDTNYTTSYP